MKVKDHGMTLDQQVMLHDSWPKMVQGTTTTTANDHPMAGERGESGDFQQRYPQRFHQANSVP